MYDYVRGFTTHIFCIIVMKLLNRFIVELHNQVLVTHCIHFVLANGFVVFIAPPAIDSPSLSIIIKFVLGVVSVNPVTLCLNKIVAIVQKYRYVTHLVNQVELHHKNICDGFEEQYKLTRVQSANSGNIVNVCDKYTVRDMGKKLHALIYADLRNGTDISNICFVIEFSTFDVHFTLCSTSSLYMHNIYVMTINLKNDNSIGAKSTDQNISIYIKGVFTHYLVVPKDDIWDMQKIGRYLEYDMSDISDRLILTKIENIFRYAFDAFGG